MRACPQVATPSGVAHDDRASLENAEERGSAGPQAPPRSHPTDLFTAPAFEVALVSGLAVDELARRLAVAARAGEACHRALAFYLHDMEARRAHQELGFASAVDFAQHRLHLSRGRARDLLLVGRKLEVLPGLDAAFVAGELPWSKVRRIARVATGQTERAWIERAREASHDELNALVGGAREGDEPKDFDRGLPRTRFVKRFVLDGLHLEMFERAREKLAAELARTVTDDDVFDEMLRLLLTSDADGSVRGRAKVDGSLFRVSVPDPMVAPAESPTPEPAAPPGGLAASLSPAPARTEADALEAAASDAVVSGRLRRAVLARDDFACRACASRRSLMVHHIIWRSHGGPAHLPNLVTLCARCHGLVHDRWLHVARSPDGTLRFTDRAGLALDVAHPQVGATVRVACATAHMSGGAQLNALLARNEDDIPDVVDGVWWQKHEHLIDWSGGRLRLKR